MRHLFVFTACALLAAACAIADDQATPTTISPERATAILLGDDQPRPGWCDHYDDWEHAYNASERIAARHGDHLPDWPADDFARWSDLLTDYGTAAERMWAAAPAGTNWPDAHRLCDR